MNATKHTGNIATDDDGRPNFAAETLPIVAPAEAKPKSTYDIDWLHHHHTIAYKRIDRQSIYFDSQSQVSSFLLI